MSQKTKVLKHLRETGRVTRNWALQNYISRLSAIMLNLKNEGVSFEARDLQNGDYEYKLLDKPKEIIEYKVGGIVVSRKVVW